MASEAQVVLAAPEVSAALMALAESAGRAALGALVAPLVSAALAAQVQLVASVALVALAASVASVASVALVALVASAVREVLAESVVLAESAASPELPAESAQARCCQAWEIVLAALASGRASFPIERLSSMPRQSARPTRFRQWTLDNRLDNRGDIRDDWQDRYQNIYDRHDNWHHGCWGDYGSYWGHMWSDHTALMALARPCGASTPRRTLSAIGATAIRITTSLTP